MKKINFVNLPDTTTPINAANLNGIQSNIEDVFNGNEAMGSIVVEDIECNQNWNDITYSGTYSSYDESTYHKLQYKKIGNQIFLRGMIKNTSVPSGAYYAIAGVLPTSLKPASNHYFLGNQADSAITINVDTDGNIRVFNTVADTWISLDGISFFID